ncbi:hypothetical protein GQ53DRAFT_838976 [Thozetella sp. PMI_491]|nr:hypothetical protein GQ53DRAFT_838976 [Thozetella sp. PMI_491]
MRSLPTALVLAGIWWLQSVEAQLDVATKILNGSPACALPCITGIITGGVCSIDSIAPCVCTNITIQANLSMCVQQSCMFGDQVRSAKLETDLCDTYPKEVKTDSITIASIVGTAVVFPAVGLRIFTRLYLTKRLWSDDYLALASAAALLATVAISFTTADLGIGQHYWNVDPNVGITLLQRFYVVQILYVVIVSLSKLTIVLFLTRLLQTPRFQLLSKYVSIFLIVKGTVFALLVAFQCNPISAVWDLTIPGAKCISLTALGIAGSVVTISDDIIILLLPLPWIWNLQLELRTRLGLAFIFSLGSFAFVTSMIRLKYMITFSKSFDPTWDYEDLILWSLIEEISVLLCGCLPALWPLLKIISPSIFGRSRLGNSNNSQGSVFSNFTNFSSNFSGFSKHLPWRSGRLSAIFNKVYKPNVVTRDENPRRSQAQMPRESIFSNFPKHRSWTLSVVIEKFYRPNPATAEVDDAVERGEGDKSHTSVLASVPEAPEPAPPRNRRLSVILDTVYKGNTGASQSDDALYRSQEKKSRASVFSTLSNHVPRSGKLYKANPAATESNDALHSGQGVDTPPVSRDGSHFDDPDIELGHLQRPESKNASNS